MTKQQILSKWKRLEKQLSSCGYESEGIISALKDLYSVYGTDLLEWLGNLFDADIGGFYYSDSALEGEGFFPDIESTGQAIGILENSGVIGSYKDIPETLRARIACFICSCEDPENGYFYNPQWSREETDKKISRRSRDSRWAVDIAEMCNFEVPYPTVFSKIENGSHENLPPYLRDKESYKKFLSDLNLEKGLYKSIHTVVSQYDQVIKLGYTDVTVDFIEGLRNKETHFFGDETIGMVITLKILHTVACFYYYIKRKMPYAKEAAEYSLKCLASSEVSDMSFVAACWDTLTKSTLLLSEYGGKEGREEAEKLVRENLELLPDYISLTAEKLRRFKKPGGSFSYSENGSSLTSQGMTVAKRGAFEGDVNGTTLAVAIPKHIVSFLSLKEDAIPLYDFDDFELFLKKIK